MMAKKLIQVLINFTQYIAIAKVFEKINKSVKIKVGENKEEVDCLSRDNEYKLLLPSTAFCQDMTILIEDILPIGSESSIEIESN